MLVIPAIDLKGGRCVRLKQGRMDDETVFSDEPHRMALHWWRKGARRLHVVDLDGAVGGRPANEKAISRIVDSVPIPVQLGGGIRDFPALEAYFELGVQFAILGTVVYDKPDFVAEACSRYPGRIILGIDAKGHNVAVEGWTRELKITPIELGKRFEKVGAAALVYTDILKDGMQSGPNLKSTRLLARNLDIPVIASGGISGLADVKAISELESDGVIAMITGRALYEGTLELGEALAAVGETTARLDSLK
jgi:phosphoribosylformimino-5-aminoimidazole carboxamide ribotide isomerase